MGKVDAAVSAVPSVLHHGEKLTFLERRDVEHWWLRRAGGAAPQPKLRLLRPRVPVGVSFRKVLHM